MARRTLKSVEAELAREKLKTEHLREKITAVQKAFGALFEGIFVSTDEATEIARDAVSERIW